VTHVVQLLLMLEQAEISLVLPLGSASTHLAHWDAGSTKTEVGGLDNGNAHLSIDKATLLNMTCPTFQRVARRADNFFSTAFPSLPISPSVEVANGMK